MDEPPGVTTTYTLSSIGPTRTYHWYYFTADQLWNAWTLSDIKIWNGGTDSPNETSPSVTLPTAGNSGRLQDEHEALTRDEGVANWIGTLLDSSWQGMDDASLLTYYAPLFRFATTETYRPSQVDLAVSNFSSDPEYANLLEHREDHYPEPIWTAVASADDSDENLDQLSLEYLANDDTDNIAYARINEPSWHDDDTSQSAAIDYDRMIGDHPTWENVIYGRVVDDPENSGDVILQYWMYYYYNQKTFDGIGDHEGDWEWVQVRLGSLGLPSAAAYSQHGAGEECAWPFVQRVGSHPVVWPGLGSHANYFAPDDYNVPIESLPDGTDTTASAGSYVVAAPRVENVTTPPGWMAWKGRWGASGATAYGHDIGVSPATPMWQDAWAAFAWENGAASCSLS